MNSASDDERALEELLDFEDLTARYVTRALLSKQYLPNMKKEGEEFPPLFTSELFSAEAAEELKTLEPKAAEWVELRTRRFDGLIRRLGVPHPVPYSRLVAHLQDHWDELRPVLGEERSKIRPEWHEDGRVLQMDYVEQAEEHLQHTRIAQGKSYLVKADISNCFSSIYSHALDWALRGKAMAKQWAKKKSPKSWEADLDFVARNVVNRETKGLLIGPAVSNILAEIVLQRVDKKLNDVEYLRYIDDYSAYFETREQAEEFLVRLQRELSHFRLDLNSRKTQIVSLREGIGSAWIAAVLSHLPVEWSGLNGARFLQQAELLAQQHPEVSVIKFAVKTILGHPGKPEDVEPVFLDELIRITHFHPHLLPAVSNEISLLKNPSPGERERIANLFRRQLSRAIRAAETDSILWLLYIVRRQLRRPLRLGKELSGELLELEDDFCWIAIASLQNSGATQIERYVRDRDWVDEGERQAHWLARYELWRVNRIRDDELSNEEKGWMMALRSRGVKFSAL